MKQESKSVNFQKFKNYPFNLSNKNIISSCMQDFLWDNYFFAMSIQPQVCAGYWFWSSE